MRVLLFATVYLALLTARFSVPNGNSVKTSFIFFEGIVKTKKHSTVYREIKFYAFRNW